MNLTCVPGDPRVVLDPFHLPCSTHSSPLPSCLLNSCVCAVAQTQANDESGGQEISKEGMETRGFGLTDITPRLLTHWPTLKQTVGPVPVPSSVDSSLTHSISIGLLSRRVAIGETLLGLLQPTYNS